MMNWLDSHCHINDEAFRDDLGNVLTRMAENDVAKAMIIANSFADFEFGLQIRHEDICFKHSLGIYPGDVDELEEEEFRRFAQKYSDPQVEAIGEIGLDYHWGKENRERQMEIFARQLQLAKDLDKPVIVHSRDAAEDTCDLLKKYRVKGVMHCYSYSAQMAQEFVRLGYYISISGSLTWKKAREPKEVIRVVPGDRLLIETDCPYLAPEPMRGKRNEPAYVVYTGRRICEELSWPEEDFKKQLNENYHELFGL